MYSIIHFSRFKPISEDDSEFLIDKFQKESVSEGVKIGDALRDNVHDAIELLGDELIQQNPKFLEKVMRNEIDIQEYYAELLRIIYRIIFILYAEQREMLPGVGTLYFEQFSLSSFRFLAEKPIKADKNYDLWKKLFITFQLVNEGNDLLGVNSFNGSLFKNENLYIIIENNLKISNDTLLKIIRLLTTSKVNNILQRINFLEISEEEIGAIYESLLDYKPYIDSNQQFKLIAGTERKSTGSYYTPKELIDILIRTTLQPLVEYRLEKAGNEINDKIQAILNIKVCDPACGGGTFLLAAMDFLGKKLAEIKTGSDSPLEDELREARREILQHCIYGVDINPLAVELAKISLWLRASVKDKPLNFLDNHIKCGNSLIGLGQKMKNLEIFPEAFEAITGNPSTGIPSESKKLQNQARKIINNEIKIRKDSKKPTLITSFLTQVKTADICSAKFQEIIEMPEESPEKIKEKEIKYQELRQNKEYILALNEANIWTSTFFWPFEGNTLGEIPRYSTIEQLKNNYKDPELKNLLKKINKIAKENQFFHWYIEFPEVFSSERNGFDCILTNPPWETLQLKEMEFFLGLDENILKAPNQSKRRQLIQQLIEINPQLHNKYEKAWKNMKKYSNFLKNSKLYQLTSKGTINTYALFVERTWRLISPNGYVGIICPTGIIMNYYMQDLFRTLVQNKSILSIFDFENRNKLFNIHRSFRFCLLSLGGKNVSQEIIPMTFYTLDPKQIQEPLSIIFEDKKNLKERLKKLPNDSILIPLEQEDFELFNPNTLTCPSFKIKKDADLLRHLYKQCSVLIKRDPESKNIISNKWGINFKRMFDRAADSKSFLLKNNIENFGAKPLNKYTIGGIWIDNKGNKYYPLYEGRMIWHYNHRYNSVEFALEGKKRKAVSIEVSEEQYKNTNFSSVPLYWVREQEIIEKLHDSNYDRSWFLVFRAITGATNERTLITTIIPKTAVAHSIILILTNINQKLLCCLIANFNSIICDYILRQKLSTNFIANFIIEQLPIFPPEKYNKKLKEYIFSNVFELLYTSNDLKDFARDFDFEREPFIWNSNRRAILQAELDAIFAHLYNLRRNDLIYILNTFPVLKRKEIEKYGEFRTKRLVLEAYDRFSEQKELFE
ncbi:MAG: Eco57I restriction-modification methylase domain-containing protein [Candidatus Helarchaeota archaeon]